MRFNDLLKRVHIRYSVYVLESTFVSNLRYLECFTLPWWASLCTAVLRDGDRLGHVVTIKVQYGLVFGHLRALQHARLDSCIQTYIIVISKIY